MAIKKEKKPTTFAGWQKLYPDAIKMTATGKKLLSNREIIHHVYGPGVKAKVLQDTSWATWSQKSGTIARINAVVSKMAAEEKTIVEPQLEQDGNI